MAEPRWATFDCYGTLVDWNAGIRRELERLLGPPKGDELLSRYHAVEPRVQSEHPTWSYREVMAAVLAELASEAGVEVPAGERDALGRSLPGWPVFAEVPGALAEARDRGWRLVALSNTDRDLLEASMQKIGVPFDGAIVASEIGSYKPAPGHWRAFQESTGADPARHVHVAQSHFHDIVPADALGIRTVWINRLGERRQPAPTRELPDLSGLADVIDELVPG
jgi:2-haloacid dehalogenase